MSSPVFKSQRSHSRVPADVHRRCSKKLVLTGVNIPEGSSSSFGQDDGGCPRLSPILRSQRARNSHRTLEATPWEKNFRGDDNRTPELLEDVLPCTPALHDDSFMESINFEEIDSICTSLESTPKRNVKNTVMMRFSSQKKICPYILRHTPQRSKALLNFNASPSIPSKCRRNGSGRDNDEQTCGKQLVSGQSRTIGKSQNFPHQSFYGEIQVVVESSCSSSGSGEGVVSVVRGTTKHKRLPAEPPQAKDGRVSPDMFGEASLGSGKERLSDSMDAVLTLIEDDYYNSSGDTRDKGGRGQALGATSEHPPLSRCSQSSLGDHSSVQPNPWDQSILKSQDSQISFSSTLESQPLIGRLEDKLKEVTTSQGALEVVRSVNERRAAAVEAALDEAARVHTHKQDLHLGPFFGLPSSVAHLLKEHRGISQLYEWQEESIRGGSGGNNLLICQPTSGGKTLVAEVLILQHILLRQRHAIFVLPYVALVQEKVRGLSAFGVELGFLVEEYAGSRGAFPPKPRKNKHVVYVATIEKAGGLVNWMIEVGRTDVEADGGVGVVVVDEVHMLAEPSGRGASLEATLTKLRFAAPKVQVVGMSATVGNLKELAEFLGATLHTGNFRPVTLTEHVKVGGDMWEVNTGAATDDDTLRNHRISYFPYSKEQLGYDRDQVGGLVGEVVPQYSCLVFCSTRRSCEAVVEMLCRVLPRELKQFRHREKVSLYRALVEEGAGVVCPILRKTIPFGIAYHHSGVTEGERRILEEGYLAGTLCCLCCTSTLAAGINLPARRVIIRSPYTGREFLSRARYKQMVGRAGRAGLDTAGESYLMLQPQHLPQARLLLTSEIEECRSTLDQDGHKGLASLVFSAVAMGVATSLPRLTHLAHSSLWALQARRDPTPTLDMDAKVTDLVESLRKKGLVRIKLEPDTHSPAQPFAEVSKEQSPGSTTMPALLSIDNNAAQAVTRAVTPSDVLTVSRLGRAAIKGNVDLDLAGQLYADLCLARENLAVNSHLHLLYLVTPYHSLNSTPFVPEVFYSAYMSLGEEEVKVARLLGITEGVVIKLSIGHSSKQVKWSVVERFYVALLLHQVWSGAGVWEASATFHVHRGFTQQTLSAAAAFASSVYHFCQELEELWAFRDLLANFTQQLSGCCSIELLPLMDLPAVKRGRARQLYRAGYRTLQDVARAEVGQLAKAVDHLALSTAAQLVNSAKMLLLERAETLQVEAEEVMLGLRGPQQPSPPPPSSRSASVQTLLGL